MIYDGKTYRNLESQVKYLTDVADQLNQLIESVRAQIPSKMIVEELPETGDPNITYYVGPKGTEPNLYYEVWVWVQEEEDGPFVWRELEDTDQVDLSGYLPIQDGATTYQQVYGKYADGTQTMFNTSVGQVGDTLVKRNANGQVYVPATPTEYDHATSKKYVDDGFVAKDISTTPYSKAYIKKSDGTQDTLSMSSTPNAGFIAQYNTGGTLRCKDPTGNGEEVVNLGYANDHYLAKNTATSSYFQAYCKNTDGSQAMCNANVTVLGGAIPLRRPSGSLVVPLTPTADDDAASKAYVDASVGQLIYKHAITLTFTVSSKLFQLDIIVLNGTSTAYTSTDGKQMLAHLKTSSYSITTSTYADNKFWSVVVCPSDKYIHDDTGVGFILEAGADGTTIYVDGIDPNYNSNITGVTISDVVTTW